MRVRELINRFSELTGPERECDVVVRRNGKKTFYGIDDVIICLRQEKYDNRTLVVLNIGDSE